METNRVITQKMKYSSQDNFVLAEKYYSILSSLNSLKLTQREIQMIAFTAVKGSMSFANVRDEFCKKYNTTSPTINNMISKLKKIGLLTKTSGKIKVNPIIQLSFGNDVTLQIRLVHE
jgi:DNA-binding MarR family transcriptional regulator